MNEVFMEFASSFGPNSGHFMGQIGCKYDQPHLYGGIGVLITKCQMVQMTPVHCFPQW